MVVRHVLTNTTPPPALTTRDAAYLLLLPDDTEGLEKLATRKLSVLHLGDVVETLPITCETKQTLAVATFVPGMEELAITSRP